MGWTPSDWTLEEVSSWDEFLTVRATGKSSCNLSHYKIFLKLESWTRLTSKHMMHKLKVTIIWLDKYPILFFNFIFKNKELFGKITVKRIGINITTVPSTCLPNNHMTQYVMTDSCEWQPKASHKRSCSFRSHTTCSRFPCSFCRRPEKSGNWHEHCRQLIIPRKHTES